MTDLRQSDIARMCQRCGTLLGNDSGAGTYWCVDGKVWLVEGMDTTMPRVEFVGDYPAFCEYVRQGILRKDNA